MRASPLLTSVHQSSLPCNVGRLPTEILQEIVTLALGQYLTDILLAPELTRSWDAIGTILHVNHCLRLCALKVLNVLWEGTFVERKTGLPRDYTHKIEYLRRLAELARTDPHAILPPARHVLSMRETTMAYERLGRSFVVHLARANVYTAGAGHAGVRFGLFEQDGMSDFARGYSSLPVELRDSMFAGLADYVVGNLLVWVRLIVLRALIDQTAKLHSLIDSATFSQVRLQAFSVYTDHSNYGFVLRTTAFLIEGSSLKQRLVFVL
ncbi:hypothetical protein H4582DRAFT_604718 [Lactarius indigo]|nr:hypothetical protein H4582DRAFT_604718 [Lactarius indigo]